MIQPELFQEQVRLAFEALRIVLRAAQVHAAVVDGDPFIATGDEDVAAFGRRQVGDEQSVIFARGYAGQRAGCVATQAVGDQPFAAAQECGIAVAVPVQYDLPIANHAGTSGMAMRGAATSSTAHCA